MDTGLIWKGMGADLALDGLALVRDDGLKTAVILSLFVDRRAEDDDVLPDNTGSRLWLLSREKQLPPVLMRAREYAEEALAWLVEDGIAESVSVETWWIGTGTLGLLVRIVRPKAPAIDYKFEYLWEGM